MGRTKFFLFQLKRTGRHLAKIMGTALLLLGIACGVFFAAVRLLYHENELPKAVIAVASSEDTAMTQFALEYVESIPSFSTLFTIMQTDEDTGRQMLEERSAVALLVIPVGTVEGILNGTNTPIEFIFAENSSGGNLSVSAALLSELANAGVHILSCAQAGIYTTASLCMDSDVDMARIFQDINYRNLQYAMTRDAMFTIVPTSATGSVSVGIYYAATALLLFLFLFGIALYSLFTENNQAYSLILSQYGISPAAEMLNRFGCMLLLYIPAAMPCIGMLLVLPFQMMTPHVASLMICMITAASIVLFCYELTHNAQTGILLLFLLSVGMLFLSGAFIPAAFFPQALTQIGRFLPTTYMHGLMTQAFYGQFSLQTALPCLAWSGIFLLLSCLCSYRNRKEAFS